MAYILVGPTAKLDFEHSWTTWLGAGDSITARVWTVTPSNPGSPSTPILTGPNSSSVIVEGLLPGMVYHVTETITTATGLRDQRTIVLRCEET